MSDAMGPMEGAAAYVELLSQVRESPIWAANRLMFERRERDQLLTQVQELRAELEKLRADAEYAKECGRQKHKVNDTLKAQLSEQSSRTQALEKRLAEAVGVIVAAEFISNEALTTVDVPGAAEYLGAKFEDLREKARAFLAKVSAPSALEGKEE